MNFTTTEILEELDRAFNGIPGFHYPEGRPEDIKYNFFLDLEHGYFETAGSRIHLYADSAEWAVVFEKNGYQNRGNAVEIELDYTGNCIDYPIDCYPERNYITNSSRVILISPMELERIQNKEGSDEETFERISKDTHDIQVRDQLIPFDHNHEHYEKLGIQIQNEDNPGRFIGFTDFIRFLNERDTELIRATEKEIRAHLPRGMDRLMTIEAFHYNSIHDPSNPPSRQETFQLIAKVLSTQDTSLWRPTQSPNNHWSNWESGHL